ncbi:hypothetical protein Bbelb_053890 [Branchiostoma belcheri]|nr:hypothetical protein Bbelb_053890 [Branchiostoma belcheri]
MPDQAGKVIPSLTQRAADLTSTTIKALEDADLADEDLALSCVTPAMLQQLKLTVGQYALLCKATAKLQAGTGPVPAAAKAKVTLDDLNQDCQDIGDLLAGATQATQAQASDDNPSVKPGEKPLLIPDFVDSYTQPETDHEVARDGQTAIILRTSGTRPKVENIRVPAWSAANAKIMDALIRGNKLQTRQDIADYLGYTVKVYELFEYRMNQHRHGFRWGRDSEQLHSDRFLRSRAPLPSRKTLGHRKPGTDRAKTAEKQEICRNFQNPSGCRRPSCNYAHVCIIRGVENPTHKCDNYKSATDPTTRQKVEMQLRNELAKGNYERCREKPTKVSAHSAIPKADSVDVGLIHDWISP